MSLQYEFDPHTGWMIKDWGTHMTLTDPPKVVSDFKARKLALELADDMSDEEDLEGTIKRAQAYYDFLTGVDPNKKPAGNESDGL